ncbi:glycosyltransferase family 4 protein [Chamaesiphon sp. OTE_20_metabat_361]|uniref:glycosyltransferase family 4 protein n=1 Tax=Chamaesiphon sp. OTE_20_metabat_361 TaxID=2964689 RepID=UPI00286AEBBB|nr:glycosyltransferase family 4 protein [Chamaesiphon sp. OTE_20_metabat_361]
MKILILHNRYKIIGGEEGVVKAEYALLEQRGHKVTVLEANNDRIVGIWGKLSTAINGLYSLSAKHQVSDAIAQLEPDLVHVHNFFPLLSPSVYDACLDAEVPVVQTLHNYRLLCPKAMPFRNGQICEDCFDRVVPWSGVLHGCYRNSHIQSASVAAMLGLHHWQGTWHKRVDAYIALSDFQKQVFVRAGLPAERFFVKPNFVFGNEFPPDSQRGDFALFVGRLSEEKGVEILLDAYLQHQLTIPLKIIGDGPLRATLAAKAAGLAQVTFLGQQDPTVVIQLMQRAQFLVFPSIWYEGFPLTIAEAYACKLPVIASRLGSMSEIVRDGVTGLHFESSNATDLASKIQWAIAHLQSMQKMGAAAYEIYQNCYTPQANYQQLLHIYQSAIDRAKMRSLN